MHTDLLDYLKIIQGEVQPTLCEALPSMTGRASMQRTASQ